MAKTAYDTIMELMINVPSSNATFAYNHILLVCGSGFLWDDKGRLVHDSEIDEKPMTVQTRKKTKNLTRRRKTMMLFSTYLKKQ